VDVHHEFSEVALCDAQGRVVRRQRLDHRDRPALRRQVRRWPAGLEVVMEASFGWGWLSDLMVEGGHKVRLSNGYKLAQMRKARGWVKTNDKDAALLGQLPQEATAWWEVWRAPPGVPDQREWMRRMERFAAGAAGVRCWIGRRTEASGTGPEGMWRWRGGWWIGCTRCGARGGCIRSGRWRRRRRRRCLVRERVGPEPRWSWPRRKGQGTWPYVGDPHRMRSWSPPGPQGRRVSMRGGQMNTWA
jgi:hypothetical protein